MSAGDFDLHALQVTGRSAPVAYFTEALDFTMFPVGERPGAGPDAVQPPKWAIPMMNIERWLSSVFGRRSGTADHEPRRCSLDIRNLVFSEDGVPILNGAFLSVRANMTTCIVGTTGTDQSAFLGLIMGLQTPDKGLVTLDGVDVATLPLDVLRNQIAIVLQEPWIKPASLRDNIVFGRPAVSSTRLRWAAEMAGVDRLAAELPFGYDTTVAGSDGHGHGLSLGQQRRIALARAMLGDPGVLLFEEPTTDIHSNEERLMHEAIKRCSEGRATVIASHRLSLARKADAVYVLDNGRLVPYRGYGRGIGRAKHHAGLWDLRVPPVVNRPEPRRHLRLVRTNDRPVPEPATSPWGITVGSEIAPGYLASGLLHRNEHTETWVAWSTAREEPVRVKIPRKQPMTYAAYEQLFREYQALKDLNHPALASVYDADLNAEMPFVVYEYLDSSSLSQVAQRRSDGLDPLDVLYTGYELAGAVNHLHRMGFVHLNLRARHVRTRDQEIVLTDFSRIRPIGAPLPQPAVPDRARRLEHRYFAPEAVACRPADPKMDVYSLGALMHRATAGSVVTAVRQGGVGLAPYASVTEQAPAPMASVVDGMLARRPCDRPTMEEVLSEFRRIMPRTLVRPKASVVTPSYPPLRLVADN